MCSELQYIFLSNFNTHWMLFYRKNGTFLELLTQMEETRYIQCLDFIIFLSFNQAFHCANHFPDATSLRILPIAHYKANYKMIFPTFFDLIQTLYKLSAPFEFHTLWHFYNFVHKHQQGLLQDQPWKCLDLNAIWHLFVNAEGIKNV